MPHLHIKIPKTFGLDNAIKYIKNKGLKPYFGLVKRIREEGEHFIFP